MSVIQFPSIARPRPYPPHVTGIEQLRKSREAKANVQEMTDAFKEGQRKRDEDERMENLRKHQRNLFYSQVRAMVRLCGKEWTMAQLSDAFVSVEFMPNWLAE